MRRVVVIILVLVALLGIVGLVGSLMVWDGTPEPAPIQKTDMGHPAGSPKAIGTSTLSHGGRVLPTPSLPRFEDTPVTSQRTGRRSAGSASP